MLAQIDYKLSREFPRILSQNYLVEGQGQSHPFFSIPAMSIAGCMWGANLVILAQICDELSPRNQIFWNSESKWPNDLDGQGNDCNFQ